MAGTPPPRTAAVPSRETVRDSSGGILPGATVQATSPSLVGVQSAVSDDQGTYRFPALTPGVYEITALLQGFTTSKTPNVQLALGQTLRVDFGLAVATLTETVSGHRRVAGDRRQAERGVSTITANSSSASRRAATSPT